MLITNVDDIVLDAAAYLVLIQALASFGVTCIGSAHKYEEWISVLKRHHRLSGNANC